MDRVGWMSPEDEQTRGPETDGAPPGQPEAAAVTGTSGEAATTAVPRPAVLDFPVVGVGASAGGLEALEALFKRIWLDSMAFVVVQHLSPDQESRLTNLLARSTTMNVVTAMDGTKVVKNVVYVLPPNADV